MKTIIAGSRNISDPAVLQAAIDASGFVITEVVWGMAKGVDTLAYEWAKAHHIRAYGYPALWVTHGRAAGPIRNQEMADAGEALIAIWDGKSRGTADMIKRAKAKGLPVYVHMVRK